MNSQAEQQEWSRHRREVVEAKEQALRATREDEHARATALIREAVAGYLADGIAPVPPRARPYRGGGTVRTGLSGWYLKRDRSLAVDAEGRYYVARVEGGLLARRAARHPSPPPHRSSSAAAPATGTPSSSRSRCAVGARIRCPHEALLAHAHWAAARHRARPRRPVRPARAAASPAAAPTGSRSPARRSPPRSPI
ncbi:hypothetical protein [Brachybacterium sp. GPGPB12]|uniref:hypothetical protein n=1 Tax=Brachybacterium sp. GPGPB12 TaxID=3023517 RepID=UPI0031342B05